MKSDHPPIAKELAVHAEQTLVEQLRDRRSEMMVSELERVALRLFEARGFGSVTVEEIATEAQISVRTFYRYFPTKDDVVLVRIKRKAIMLKEILAGRPLDEHPLRSIRVASELVASYEDPVLVKQWIATAKDSPSVTQSVLGCIHLHTQPVLAEFLRSRLDLRDDSMVPTMLAAAVGGVVQEAHRHWFTHGGDLGTTVTRGLQVLEEAMGGLAPG
jgi:AcrR family transcriptional regulator